VQPGFKPQLSVTYDSDVANRSLARLVRNVYRALFADAYFKIVDTTNKSISVQRFNVTGWEVEPTNVSTADLSHH
jgi:hypothetical protein